MANHKSAIKRNRQNARRKEVNKKAIAKMKTLVKKVLASTKADEALPVYKEAVAFLDKSVTKGRLHKNNAGRKKSALTLHMNKLGAAN